MDIISKRNGYVRLTGNTLALSLREELLDLGLDTDDLVTITLVKDKDGKKQIVIERIK